MRDNNVEYRVKMFSLRSNWGDIFHTFCKFYSYFDQTTNISDDQKREEKMQNCVLLIRKKKTKPQNKILRNDELSGNTHQVDEASQATAIIRSALESLKLASS